jgi:membrane protein YqaA with SNARE-associated domain
LLTYLIINGTDAFTAVVVASAGNWLGGMSSYAIGYLGKWEWIEKYFNTCTLMQKFNGRLLMRYLSLIPA